MLHLLLIWWTILYPCEVKHEQIKRLSQEYPLPPFLFALLPPRLFDSLLALFRVEISRRAQTPLVAGDQRSNHGLFARFVVVLGVAFRGKRSGVKARPVDLHQLV